MLDGGKQILITLISHTRLGQYLLQRIKRKEETPRCQSDATLRIRLKSPRIYGWNVRLGI